MNIRLSRALPLLGLALLLAGGLTAQVRMPQDTEEIRLYPASANADGTLNCFPRCGPLGNCC